LANKNRTTYFRVGGQGFDFGINRRFQFIGGKFYFSKKIIRIKEPSVPVISKAAKSQQLSQEPEVIRVSINKTLRTVLAGKNRFSEFF